MRKWKATVGDLKVHYYLLLFSGGSRIFLKEVPTPNAGVLTYYFAENCMKMKEFRHVGRVPGAP